MQPSAAPKQSDVKDKTTDATALLASIEASASAHAAPTSSAPVAKANREPTTTTTTTTVGVAVAASSTTNTMSTASSASLTALNSADAVEGRPPLEKKARLDIAGPQPSSLSPTPPRTTIAAKPIVTAVTAKPSMSGSSISSSAKVPVPSALVTTVPNAMTGLNAIASATASTGVAHVQTSQAIPQRVAVTAGTSLGRVPTATTAQSVASSTTGTAVAATTTTTTTAKTTAAVTSRTTTTTSTTATTPAATSGKATAVTSQTTTTPPPSWSTAQLLHPEYTTIRQTVKDLMALLQLYGPLTANQLEYNLPPVSSSSSAPVASTTATSAHSTSVVTTPAATTVTSSSSTGSSNATTVQAPWSVRDVLSILVALGLVQQVEGTSQYCMHEGIPRADAILPEDVPAAILQAEQEAHASWKRSQMLRAALVNHQHQMMSASSTTTKSPKQQSSSSAAAKPQTVKAILKQIVTTYPEVVHDPVYWTALRNCHIDVSPPISSLSPPSEKPAPASTIPKLSSGNNRNTAKQPGSSALTTAPVGTKSMADVTTKAANSRQVLTAATVAAIDDATVSVAKPTATNLIGRVVAPQPKATIPTLSQPTAAPPKNSVSMSSTATMATSSTSGGTFGWKGGPSVTTLPTRQPGPILTATSSLPSMSGVATKPAATTVPAANPAAIATPSLTTDTVKRQLPTIATVASHPNAAAQTKSTDTAGKV